MTDAASGIRRALATRLTAAGTQVLLADIDDQAVHQLADELHAWAMTVDVARPDDMEALAAGRYASLVCLNAGIVGPSTGAPWTVPPAEWERVFAVNVCGVVNGLRAFVPRLLQANAERDVLVTAPLAGVLTFPDRRCLPSVEARRPGHRRASRPAASRQAVTVTVICPALVRTAMSAIGADPDDLAEAALRAVAQESFAQIPIEWHAAVLHRAARLARGEQPTAPQPR